MDKTQKDIDLIKKYYNGELDGRAMQNLEERALEDPFLADAMEGFDESGFRGKDIETLKERMAVRLQQGGGRTNSGGITIWAIAASIVVLIGLFTIYISLPDEDNVLNENEIAVNAASPGLKDTGRLVDQTRQDSTLELIESSPAVVQSVSPPKAIDEDLGSGDQIVIESVASKRVASDSLLAKPTSAYMPQLSRKTPMSDEGISKTAKGKIFDSQTKENISGVVITDPSSGNVAISDEEGKFELPTSVKSNKLLVNSAGYDTKEVLLGRQDSLKIAIKQDTEPLDNVAVVAPAQSNRRVLAGPAGGWGQFRKYLDRNNELETREVGPVTVEFFIEPSGELSNFKILRSLSKLADARAINLIKNYQTWNGASDGTTNKVKITIRFR